MIRIDVPGQGKIELTHLVLDYNGTLACDGILLNGVVERLDKLKQSIDIHVITADTFGNVRTQLKNIKCIVHLLERGQQDIGKLRYIEQLGVSNTVCIGNGRNDNLMLEAAALGIAVLQTEGMARVTMLNADVIARDIGDALDLLLHTKRLVATLRS